MRHPGSASSPRGPFRVRLSSPQHPRPLRVLRGHDEANACHRDTGPGAARDTKSRPGVHFSFGIGLPFFGAVVAPAPAVVVPAPAYLPSPAYYPYPYPPVVAYGPSGYYGGSVVVWGRHWHDRGWHGDWRRARW